MHGNKVAERRMHPSHAWGAAREMRNFSILKFDGQLVMRDMTVIQCARRDLFPSRFFLPYFLGGKFDPTNAI
jgi:hypothetical protein